MPPPTPTETGARTCRNSRPAHIRSGCSRAISPRGASSFFATRLALVNTTTVPATVLLRFLKTDGTVATATLAINPLSRATVNPAATLGGRRRRVLDRRRSRRAGRRRPHDEVGRRAATAATPRPASPRPRLTWYLAEGATHSGFDLFYLMQNPTATAASVQVTYLLPAPAAPIVKTYTVPANSRFNIWVNQRGRGARRRTDVSAVIESTNDVPIIVERAMYLIAGGLTFGAGHESAGVTRAGDELVPGRRRDGPVLRPVRAHREPDATATRRSRRATCCRTARRSRRRYTVRARSSRFNIWVDLRGSRGWPTRRSRRRSRRTNGVPIIVERAMWWPGPTAATWQEAHNSPGATTTGTRWALAEGEAGGPRQTETYILIANTSATAGHGAGHAALRGRHDGASGRSRSTANSRFNVAVGGDFPRPPASASAPSSRASARRRPQIVVERAMYSNALRRRLGGGHQRAATKLQ